MTTRRAPGGWVQKLGMIAGLYCGFRYGYRVGLLLLPAGTDGWLAFFAGFFVTVPAIVMVFNAIDARRQEENEGGTSRVRLVMEGIPWRLAARLIQAALIFGPPAALYWAWRSGWIANLLAGVSS